MSTGSAKNEAVLNGYDEAIVLNDLRRVCERGERGESLLVRDGALYTPSYADTILEGLTRDKIIELAREELGMQTMIRPLARSELYYADEMFLTGTGVQVAAITSVDKRLVGNGEVGPIASTLQRLYFEAARGRNPKYAGWLTPVNVTARAGHAVATAS